jgi:redox-sensitive bicupin YhaK (pirin superfamily)
LRFIQIWLNPHSKNLKPNYGSFTSKPADRQNKWAHLVTDVNSNDSVAPIKINTDANFFVTQTQAGHNMTFELKAGRQAYMICVEGSEVHIQSDSGLNETGLRASSFKKEL